MRDPSQRNDDPAPLPRSMIWVAVDTGGVAVISLAAILITARLIGPTDFGSAAVAIGIIQFLSLYVEGLLHDALIRDDDAEDGVFDSAFWFLLGVGGVLAIVAIGAALLLRDTSVGEIALLVAAASLSLPLGGMIGVLNARHRRDLRYRDVARPSVIGKLFGTAVGLAGAWLGAGAWSLVLQQVAGALAQWLALVVQGGWRPRRSGSFASLAPLWRFSLTNVASFSLINLRGQGFVVMAALTGGLSAAGYVNVAFRLASTPQILLRTALTNLGYPILVKHRNDAAAIRSAYTQLNRLIGYTIPAAFLGLAACADLLVPVVLGARWTPSVGCLRIIAIGAAVYFFRTPSSLLLRAIGKIKYSFVSSVVALTVTLGGIAVFWPRDISILAMLWIAPTILILPITFYVVGKEMRWTIADQVRGAWLPTVCAAAMALLVQTSSPMLRVLSDSIALFTSVALGAATYAFLLFCFDRSFMMGMVRQAWYTVRRDRGGLEAEVPRP